MIRYILYSLFIFFISFGSDLKLESIYIENLPKGYRQVFREFLKENFNISEHSKNILNVRLSWTGMSYNICFDFLFFDKRKKISCFTANNAQEIYPKTFIFLDDFKKHNPSEKETVLTLGIKESISARKIRITSEKRDVLVDYTEIKVEKKKKEPFIRGVLNIDTVILDEDNSKKLLSFLLKGFKVKEILIIK